MRKFVIFFLALFVLSCSCVRRFPDPEGSDVRDVASHTVKVFVELGGVKMTKDSTGEILKRSDTVKWVGSGVVVDIRGSKSLVMTAAHVSNIDPFMMGQDEVGNPALFIVQTEKLTVETLEGRMCDAKQIKADSTHDIAILDVDCIAGTKAEFASELPPIGAMVLTSGAALGYHPENVFVITDGRFMGIDKKDDKVVVTVPAASGHSGSGMFYKGKIFGILTARMIDFEHITLGTQLQFLNELFASARGEWK